MRWQKLMASLIFWVAFAQNSLQVGLESKLHLRLNALDSAAISWFETRANLNFSPSLNKKITSKVGLEIRAKGLSRLNSVSQLTESASEPVSVLLGENYLSVYDVIPNLTLTAGKKLIRWGTADVINPTDNIVTPDYSDPILWDAKRPVWLIHTEYNPISLLGLELIAKPIFEPALLPPKTWFGMENLPTAEQLRQGLVASLINQGLDTVTARKFAAKYTITIQEDFAMPKNTLKNMSYGGKIKTHFSIFDVSASLFRGYDFLPFATPIITMNPQDSTLDFVLQERYPRKTIIGSDIATNILDVGIWAEAGYSIYDDSIPDNKLAVIVGADYSFQGFYANFQFFYGQFPFALTQSNYNFILGALERKFLSDRLLLRLGGIVDIKKGSYGFLPMFRWLPADGAEIELGGLFFGGKAGTVFNLLSCVKEIYFGVRHRF
jgi:hypothetical protein